MLTQFIKLYLVAVPVLAMLDYLWLGVITKSFIQRQLGVLMRPDIQWIPGILFYLMFAAGVVIFAVFPGIEKGSLLRTIALAAFLGFVAYGTYEFTNAATLIGWPRGLIIPDILWGTAASAITGAVVFLVARYLL